MLVMRTSRLMTALAAGILLLGADHARAAERITLSNGFDLTCERHEAVGGKVRLYLDERADSFVEVLQGEIVSVDVVPDAPRAVAKTTALTDPKSVAGVRAELTQADLKQLLVTAGAEQNLSVELLASVVRAESGGHARAVSRTGAQGLMQLMPKTAAGLGVADSFEPGQNVHGGSAYLNSLLVRYHDNLELALAAYNAGPGAVDRWHGIPPYRETRAYVARVIHEFNKSYYQRRRESNASQIAPSVKAAKDREAGEVAAPQTRAKVGPSTRVARAG